LVYWDFALFLHPTPWKTVTLENLILPQLVTTVLYRPHKNPLLVSITAVNNQHTSAQHSGATFCQLCSRFWM